MAHLLVSAAHKSSGKTTVSIGLCAALRARGLVVQPFKKGPDYIDPMWLALAAGRSCHNLDFHTQGREEIVALAAARSADADLALIEGNKGLYDGLDLEGSNSNAALARLLHAPVVLVLDARGMTRGIAPLILGYQAFEPEVDIAGVILNRLGGSRHEAKLRAVIEHYTDVPVLGAVHQSPALEIVERHLGLVPSSEHGAAAERIRAAGEAVAAQVDLDALLEVARRAPPLQSPPPVEPSARPLDLTVAVLRDSAFGFYYQGDLEALERAGARLAFVDSLRDRRLPERADALLIGGGFPETHMAALEANRELRGAIREALAGGLPAYAECGGLMYLCRGIRWRGERREMVGLIPAEAVMCDRPQGRGYVRLAETGEHPWPGAAAGEIAAHEFHYSRLEGLPAEGLRYAYEVRRGQGIDGRRDGLVLGNTLACYSHLRDVAAHRWTSRFLDFVRAVRARRGRPASAHNEPAEAAPAAARSLKP